MSPPYSILLTSVVAFTGANAIAGEPATRGSMADICPAKVTPRMKLEAMSDDLVLRTPPQGRPSGAAKAEAAEAQRQCMEWQRKLAGVPKETWDKMADAERVDAVENAKAARLKDPPVKTP